MIPSALSFHTFHESPEELADKLIDGNGTVEGVVVVAAAVAVAAPTEVTIVEADGSVAAEADGGTAVIATGAAFNPKADGSGSSPDMVPQTFSCCSLA